MTATALSEQRCPAATPSPRSPSRDGVAPCWMRLWTHVISCLDNTKFPSSFDLGTQQRKESTLIFQSQHMFCNFDRASFRVNTNLDVRLWKREPNSATRCGRTRRCADWLICLWRKCSTLKRPWPAWLLQTTVKFSQWVILPVLPFLYFKYRLFNVIFHIQTRAISWSWLHWLLKVHKSVHIQMINTRTDKHARNRKIVCICSPLSYFLTLSSPTVPTVQNASWKEEPLQPVCPLHDM